MVALRFAECLVRAARHLANGSKVDDLLAIVYLLES